MPILRKIRRYIATFLISIGLSYPACALICPKGIGGCISPGKCLLFVDADENLLCDYIIQSESTGQDSTSLFTPVSASQGSFSPDPALSTQVIPSRSIPDALGFEPSLVTLILSLITGILLFISCSVGLTLFMRRWFPFHTNQNTCSVSAITWLPSLCISLVCISLIYGEALPGIIFPIMYSILGILIAVYLWTAGCMTRRITVIMAVCGTIMGFVFVAPIMPLEIGWVVNVISGTRVPVLSVIFLMTLCLLTFMFGRIFCGNICPVGALQELAYLVPGRKYVIHRKIILELIRLGVFITTITALVYQIDLMGFTGLFDLFSFRFTVGFFIAVGLVIVSIIVYRPICQLICPFGLIFSLIAHFSICRLRRNEFCPGCKKCELSCPTGAAEKDNSKRECYFCGKCIDSCPGDMDLTYGR